MKQMGSIKEENKDTTTAPAATPVLDEQTAAKNTSGRKKYHFSAMYAANVWHNTVQRVKPYHQEIKP